MRSWRPWKLVGVTFLMVYVLAVMAMTVYAQEGTETMEPLVNLLDNPVVLFGLGGGMIVTVVLSVLKTFGVVGKGDGKIPTLLANFIVSAIVVTGSGVLNGQDVGTAAIAGITALLSAIGYHETAGHGLKKLAGNS